MRSWTAGGRISCTRLDLADGGPLSSMQQTPPYIAAGIDVVPVDWVNQRLDELGEAWHVAWGLEGYELPALPD
jgi:hypothetical protein